ncbi:type I DNA topoisomerase [Segnochrobactraceae bacterium EtOH-i3]
MKVVIVESPAKAKTINKYLGSDYHVLASYGHVRDLPAKDGSVRPDEDFALTWEVDGKASKRLSEIAQAVKDSDRLILATDPDREGEAISWHVLEVLRNKRALKDQPVERVVFNAITKQSILDAMKHPRTIDRPLVDAYLARRALDYLVGFTLSPVLWRKLPGARSAGRVQSVALRLVCDREDEVERFVPKEYWSIIATLATPRAEEFEARLSAYRGEKMTRLSVGNETEARAIAALLEKGSYVVKSVEAKPQKRHPQPPFTTSTLQQEASRKLGFSSARTMQIAQKLYEGVDIGGETVGLITYMRTDGVDMAPEAIESIRREIGARHGARYLPAQPRRYQVKAKNAQEAHEAIRPTDAARLPDTLRHLDPDQARLYELIWKRAVASQMESADFERTTVDIDVSGGELGMRATGSVVRFDGFLALYQEGRDDEEDEESRRLPAMSSGDGLTKKRIATEQHFTEPPPRYTEATLIKKMEELGIGRPSTYAATMAVLRDRGYVKLDKKRLVPEDKGRLVTAFLKSFFSRYVEYDFTADLEDKLDRISNGDLAWKDVLRDFWRDFHGTVEGTKGLRVTEVLDSLNDALAAHIFPPKPDGSDPRACPTCGTGRLSLKLGKFGSFIGCSNYPECRYTRQLAASEGEEATAAAEPRVLGTDPATGEEVSVRDGRFGPYIQSGEGTKPKRATIPRGWDPSSVDLEKALALLHLPREVGLHPETGKPITAAIGRFGPFVLHDGTYANLDSVDEVFTVGLNRAVSLIAEKKEKGGRGRGAAAPPLKDLGEHPTLGGKVTVQSGRYGPYVKFDKINATIPKDIDPASLTMDQAVALIAARAESAGKTVKAKAAPKAKAAKKDADAAETPKKPRAKKAAAPADGEAAPAKKPRATRAKKAAPEG